MEDGSGTAALQGGLGRAYTLERAIGRGGMATVYLADDAKHGRTVALKALLPELSAAVGPARFRREIAIVAQLQHPHILPVLDSGETSAGQLWFTMPYVNGESLRDRLVREKQLPIEDALRITRQIAGALAYAHKYGVVHRDVKPENILLTKEGDALLADFGVARASMLGVASSGTTTETGIAPGTPLYMSPEQATGTHELDGRSDIFSLGCVLYEMLAGEPPFTGPNQHAIVARRLTERHRPLRAVRERIPATVERAVDTALAKAPADRFRSAAEFAQALTAPAGASVPRWLPRLAVGAGAAVLVGLGLITAWRAWGPASVGSGGVRMAVLPFENLGDSSDAYFADGVTDAIRAKLTALPGLTVIWPGTSTAYRHANKTPRQIAEDLGGVRYLLIGKIRWAKTSASSSRVQVTPALIDVTTGADTWEQPFDRPLTDVFEVQGEVARQVAEHLRVTLTPSAKQALAARPTSNLDAYDAYLRGRALDQKGIAAATRRRAAAEYAEAVRLDSTFAAAWAGLSVARSLAFSFGGSVAADSVGAFGAATRALALVPDLPEGHAALGVYYRQVTGDLDRSIDEFRLGLRIAPDNADLLRGAGLTEAARHRNDTALVYMEHAVRAEPRNSYALMNLAVVLVDLCRLSDAQRMLDRALAVEPGNITTIEYRFGTAVDLGDVAGARTVLRNAASSVDSAILLAHVAFRSWALDSAQQRAIARLPLSAFDGMIYSWLEARSKAYVLLGDARRARALRDSLLVDVDERMRSDDDPDLAIARALVLARLGRGREAVDAIEQVSARAAARLDFGNRFDIAKVYATAGAREPALHLLDSLSREPCGIQPVELRASPDFAALRGDPRFERLIAASASSR